MCCSLSDDEMEEDMFKIGDYVAHYKEGVCQVVDIGKISLSCSDNEKEYYTLKPIYRTTTGFPIAATVSRSSS